MDCVRSGREPGPPGAIRRAVSWSRLPFDDRRLVVPPRWANASAAANADSGWRALVLWSAAAAANDDEDGNNVGSGVADVGGWNAQACAVLPTACALLRGEGAVVGTVGADTGVAQHVPHGAVKVLRLLCGHELLPHCGPSNGRLTAHLALALPRGLPWVAQPRLRVGNRSHSWRTDEVLVFDDSFEHAVDWPDQNAARVAVAEAKARGEECSRDVLHFTLWHPQLHSDARGCSPLTD
eukprot:SAG11_NODE_2598_length_3183_cov_4.460765_1_plen_238_part_00